VDRLKLYTNEKLDLLRQSGDPLADAAISQLIHLPELCRSINAATCLEDILSLDIPEAARTYFTFFLTTPDFIDAEKCLSAQVFFEKQGQGYLSMLGFYSLPYCYAFADGAQVLVRSKRIVDDIGKRLTETGLFVLDSFKPGSFVDHNEPLLTLAKVRLIHAFSRMMIFKFSKDWQKEWGIPINMEDLIGTNLAFSLIVYRGLERIGSSINKTQAENLLHYWKVIGFYLGLAVEYWPVNTKEAYELEKLIRKRHLKGSDAGKLLTKSLLDFFKANSPSPQLSGIIDAIVAYLLGEEAATALGLQASATLPKPAVALLLDSPLWGQRASSCILLRKQFISRAISQFGEAPELKIPVIDRS
jgi:hypothetical protein